MHVPPFTQGEDAHSLMLIRQLGPMNPGAHLHKNQLTPSIQVPLLWQGLGLQSSESKEEIDPIRELCLLGKYKICNSMN